MSISIESSSFKEKESETYKVSSTRFNNSITRQKFSNHFERVQLKKQLFAAFSNVQPFFRMLYSLSLFFSELHQEKRQILLNVEDRALKPLQEIQVFQKNGHKKLFSPKIFNAQLSVVGRYRYRTVRKSEKKLISGGKGRHSLQFVRDFFFFSSCIYPLG